MNFVLAKVNETLFSGIAESVTLPGSAGELTVLSHHEPLITTLKAGTITVRAKGEPEQTFAIVGGVLEVRAEGATVIL